MYIYIYIMKRERERDTEREREISYEPDAARRDGALSHAGLRFVSLRFASAQSRFLCSVVAAAQHDAMERAVT